MVSQGYTASMRKLWLPLLFALLLAPAGAVAILLLSPAALTQALQWGSTQLTPYRLEVSGLELSLPERSLRFDALYLHQQGASGAPLLAILDFRGETRYGDLWNGELRNTEFTLGSAVVYVAANDDAEDPSPEDWLQHMRWLPRQFQVDQLHIISDAGQVNIVPLLGLQGERREAGGFVARGQANLPAHYLSLNVQLDEAQRSGSRTGVHVTAEVTSPDDSRARLEGEFLADSETIAYDFVVDARYPSVETFLSAFPAAPEFEGELSLSGRIRGDAAGFALTDAAFLLDNLPDYRFEASGSLAGATGTDPVLSLIASGELAAMDQLLTWVGIDLSPLGSARASIALSGTLGAPAVDQMTVVTSSNEGLWLSINGSSGPGSLTSVTVPEGSDFSVHLDAPNLSVLQPWLQAELPLDPGPWQLSARLRERAGRLSVENINARAGSRDTLQISLSGAVGELSLDQPGGADALSGLDLALSAISPDLKAALEQVELPFPMPADIALEGSVQVLGSGTALRLQGGEARLSRGDSSLRLAALQSILEQASGWRPRQFAGSFHLVVADSREWRDVLPKLPDYPLQMSIDGDLRQISADDLALDKVQARMEGPGLALHAQGAAPRLLQNPRLDLSLNLEDLDSGQLLARFVPQLQLPRELANLTGTVDVFWTPDVLTLEQINLRSAAHSPLLLDLQGDLSRQASGWQSDLHVELGSDDRAFLQAVTGLKLAPLSSTGHFTLDDTSFSLDGSARFGSTPLNIGLQGQHREMRPTELSLDLSAPTLKLADLGLQADLSAPEGYRPAQRLEAVEAERRSLQALLDRAPRYPLALKARIGHLEGEQSRFDDIRIQLSGHNGHFLLQEFDFLYDEALAQLRGVVDISVSPPGLSIAGEAQRIPLNTLTRDLGFDNDITGILHLRTGISGEGLDLGSLLSSADGSLSLALEDATIEGAAYDVLATDLLAWLYSGAAMESSTVIECTMADFDFRDGIASSDNLYAASARMVATGRARFDLGQRTLDVALTPRSRSRRLEIPSQITLKGDIASPRTWISPVTTTLDLTTEIISLLPRMLLRVLGITSGERFADRECVLPGSGSDRED